MAQFKIAHGQTKNLPTALEDGQVYVTYDSNGQNGKIFADVEISGKTVRVALEGEQGPQGKSAYQYAQEGGYQGTEEEFTQLLSGLDSEIENHNQDELAHPDIREKISQLASEIEDLKKGEDTSYTNVLPLALAIDGTSVYNGKGWKENTRWSGSSASDVDNIGTYLTGYIPVQAGDVVRLKNIIMPKMEEYTYCIHLYDTIGSVTIGSFNGTTLEQYQEALWDAEGNLVQFNMHSGASNYIRIQCGGIDDSSVITINEVITEDELGVKIANLEEKVVDLDTRITSLEETGVSSESDNVPEYVKTEAEAVIDRVIAAQGNKTFTFAAITDMHYGNANYTDGIKHACQALKYIDERIKLDAVAVLGDYTDGYPASAYANAISDFKNINKILDTLRFGQNLRIQGNHDYYEAHKGEINRFIASYSEGVTWGDITGGYFYKDFDGYKIRVICVNTTEAGGGDIGVSTKQYDWFANSLDLSSKADVSEWQILILSHHPLDWWSNSYVFAYILNAYKKGTTWSNNTISVDFTDKNSATLIGNIHGHIHNFLTDYIHFGNVNGGNKSDILRMATPNACYGRENQYTESVVGVSTWVEDTTYSKTIDSAEDTAFCIYIINLEACTITAICYGAGYDRENVGYLSKAPIVNIIDTVGYTDTKRLSATSGEVRDGAENNFVTGYIELGNIGDVYRTSGTDFRITTNGYSCMCIYKPDKTFTTAMTYFENDSSIQGIDYTIDENGNLTLTLNSGFERSGGFIRLCGNGSGANLLVTKNQPIE